MLFTLQQKNTFHSILASDGQISYVLMMYTQISWTLTNSTLPAWAGFSAGDGARYTSITDTFSVSIRNLSSASNINQDGVWIFRVDENTVLSGGKNYLNTYAHIDIYANFLKIAKMLTDSSLASR